MDIGMLLASNVDDPALESFYRDLQGCMLSRLLDRDYDRDELDFSLKKRRSIRIRKNRIYKHKVLRVHYTTYDMRRSTDSVNP
ncbi:hypothetical protein QCA50_007115 [Cerrena zonata]|uniref:Uncharacterized protein n=1 Tax=Cerrena zonata TaxID=2478898 RepID=A0AAW0GCE8_9APHY